MVSPRPLRAPDVQEFPPGSPAHPRRGEPHGPAGLPRPAGPLHARGYFTGFHTEQRSDVNCPSDERIVTVIFRALVAKLLSTISPDSEVRSQ